MRWGGDLRHGVKSRLALGLHEPWKGFNSSPFKAVGPGARLPQAGAQEVNVSLLRQGTRGLQDLFT